MAEFSFRFRDDADDLGQVADPGITVDAFAAQTNATAVRLEPGDDARALLPHLARLRLVEINFPAFTDGRGYTAARTLREAGYAGELRAVGDIGVDQLWQVRRCGFDAIAPDTPLDPADAAAALGRWPFAYHPAADDAAPIWARRHGAG